MGFKLKLLRNVFKLISPQDKPVPCPELCVAVMKSIADDRRPPYSDVACRNGYNGEPNVVCDIDVSPE
eukprot:5669469-Amphidinium_carterae.1